MGRRVIRKNKIDIIYSYFGIGLYTRKIPQVSGSADSNLYFPEIDFWIEYKGLSKLKRKIVDIYRIWGLRRVNGIIFENKVLEERCRQIYGIRNTTFIKPSINFNFENKSFNIPIKINSSKGLFLCGWQRNKNFTLIPQIALELKKAERNFHFILTAPLDNSPDHKDFIQEIRKHGVEDMVTIIGRVKKEQLSSLYNQIDYVFLLSKLESFSNNIIEAWYFEKPLIISDEPWSRSICKNGAIYVNRNSAKVIAQQITKYEKDKSLKYEVINNARKIFCTYPDIKQRTKEELNYLQYVYKNY